GAAAVIRRRDTRPGDPTKTGQKTMRQRGWIASADREPRPVDVALLDTMQVVVDAPLVIPAIRVIRARFTAAGPTGPLGPAPHPARTPPAPPARARVRSLPTSFPWRSQHEPVRELS